VQRFVEAMKCTEADLLKIQEIYFYPPPRRVRG